MEKGSKVAIVCCSNGQVPSYKEKVDDLLKVLNNIGLEPVCSEYIYQKKSVFSGTAKERAKALMDFYINDEIKAIFDISGGDIANEILPHIDFDIVSKSTKTFWGYSDLTTIINSIYAKANKESVLYQVRNLIYDNKDIQIKNFKETLFEEKESLFDFSYDFIKGDRLEGIVVGGNIRCLLKLAGTEYWPDMTDKVLLLEALGGTAAQMTTYLSQLKLLGVFNKVKGIILGTFTKMEEGKCEPSIIELLEEYIDRDIPIVKTQEIGHGTNSKAIVIGRKIILERA